MSSISSTANIASIASHPTAATPVLQQRSAEEATESSATRNAEKQGGGLAPYSAGLVNKTA